MTIGEMSLCGGFTHIEKPELLAALHDPTTRQQIEGYVAELLQSPRAKSLALVRARRKDATLIKRSTTGTRMCPCGGEARRNRKSRIDPAKIKQTKPQESPGTRLCAVMPITFTCASGHS